MMGDMTRGFVVGRRCVVVVVALGAVPVCLEAAASGHGPTAGVSEEKNV